ncbi:adult-specific rigid cuticular protein 15.5-like [Tachypleus tridentatus]|uniref:adult-specific rigid cuticular protein 15.5-like n=1 Tax=Tachypleus tridentatus TaxID=6853 RepID=UPI003FCF30E6
MCKAVILFALIAIVKAGLPALHVPLGYAATSGVSNLARQQDSHGNYKFGYDIVRGTGASNSRYEQGDSHGNKIGSYSIADIDGRIRIVDYVADDYGFRAFIRTNEPGTKNDDPADVEINGHAHPAANTLFAAHAHGLPSYASPVLDNRVSQPYVPLVKSYAPVPAPQTATDTYINCLSLIE